MSVVKKYRGHIEKCIAAYVKDRLKDRDDLDDNTVFITHTEIPQENIEAAQAGIEKYHPFRHVYETVAGCTISCHCGPGTLGVLFVRNK